MCRLVSERAKSADIELNILTNAKVRAGHNFVGIKRLAIGSDFGIGFVRV